MPFTEAATHLQFRCRMAPHPRPSTPGLAAGKMDEVAFLRLSPLKVVTPFRFIPRSSKSFAAVPSFTVANAHPLFEVVGHCCCRLSPLLSGVKVSCGVVVTTDRS